MSSERPNESAVGWITCPACETRWPPATIACPADGTRLVRTDPGGLVPIDDDDDAPIKSGTRVGEYVIEGLLGAGGMGEVYGARHPVIDKQVAIKLMSRACSANPASVERFVQEAKAVNAIGHPNIVDIFSFGRTDDGRCFFVMELLRGETLRTRLDQGVMSPFQSYEILDTILDALEAAHGAGIVHRDLKPDNIFLVPGRGAARHRETVKLLDFGIAKLSGDGLTKRGSKTQTGTVVGTPSYMAPEQASGGVIEGPADIYALGVMAFEMATGTRPFEAESMVQIMAAHVAIPPPRPSSIRPLAARFEGLILDMLAKQPSDRPPIATIRMELSMLRADVTRNAAMVTAPDANDGAAARRAGTDPTLAAPPTPTPQPLVTPSALTAELPRVVGAQPSPDPEAIRTRPSTPRLQVKTDPETKVPTDPGRFRTVPGGGVALAGAQRSRAPILFGALAVIAVAVAMVLAMRGSSPAADASGSAATRARTELPVAAPPSSTTSSTPPPAPGEPEPVAATAPSAPPPAAKKPAAKKPRAAAAPATTTPPPPPPPEPAKPKTDVDAVRDPFANGGTR